MNKLTTEQKKWTRVIHILSACLWGGGAFSMVLLQYMATPASGDALYWRDLCLKYIDQYVVTSGALGCLCTGFIFALKSSWGFFKFRWIIVKWIINVGFILFGFFFYMPWLKRMSDLSGNLKLMALQTPEYLQGQTMHEIIIVAISACLILLLWISTFKPWGKTALHDTKTKDA